MHNAFSLALHSQKLVLCALPRSHRTQRWYPFEAGELMSPSLSRRSFVKLAAAAAAAGSSRHRSFAAASPSANVLQTLPYSSVQLGDGRAKRQFDDHHSLFLHLDDDRLLKPFRQKAGLPAPGEDMGGWYDLEGFDLARNDFHAFVPGHSFGQYVSGLARACAITGSGATREKVNRLVKGYAETLDDKASFFAGYRLPAYTYDKLSCGLMDAHEFAGDPMALAVHEKLTRAAMAYLPEKALSRAEQRSRPHKDESFTWDETYTLPENLFLAYRRSGKDFYRDLAVRFLEDDTYFGPLSIGQNVLTGEHAYSHMNAFSSAMQAYLVLGSQKHLAAARNGFAMVAAQSFAPGGWGPNEAFIEPGTGQLGDSLSKTHASFETPCGAYAHFKITRYLLQVTTDARYGDSMERVLYNTILGAKPIQPEGWSFYYSDYANVGKKVYHRDKWPCCSGTLPQLAADYHISIYLRAQDGVYINLFVPSTLLYEHGGSRLQLRQTTDYPFSEEVEIQVSASTPVEHAIYLRIPGWLQKEPEISVNGRPLNSPLKPGEFAVIRRTWKTGDIIHVRMPMSLDLQAVDAQNPDLVSLQHGPLVLFALADAQPGFAHSELLNARPANNPKGDWLAKNIAGTTVVMRPFMSIDEESYSTYVRVT